MIQNLQISNFKSIKQLELDCKKINVFIGEPNTGKSNILEALGMFSYARYYREGELRNFVRFQRTSNIFYDELLNETVEIKLDSYTLRIGFEEGRFTGRIFETEDLLVELDGDYKNFKVHSFKGQGREKIPPIKLYKFVILDRFDMPESEFLLPPSGRNLLSLLLTNKELRVTTNRIFSYFGLRLVLEPQEGVIKVQKQLEDIVVSFPYPLISDTLQRIVFYMSAILSNKNSVLTMEEPEAHSFPYYTKYLAETIALDERNNQYFISTHNPYFLLPLVEKASKDNLAIFITYFDEYQTKTKLLSGDEVDEIMQIDVFSNIERYLEKK